MDERKRIERRVYIRNLFREATSIGNTVSYRPGDTRSGIEDAGGGI